MKQPTVDQQVTAEVIGTFVLTFFGCGAVHAAACTATKFIRNCVCEAGRCC